MADASPTDASPTDASPTTHTPIGSSAARPSWASKPRYSSEGALATSEKAARVNRDESKYGTIAEIGAGQEVARWFFRVGGAAGTVAKTMSAYDMVVSDTIYGECGRYVSHERLSDMLDHEYELLVHRLDEPRGAETTFFAFANTVAARSYSRRNDSHGWMGIRFQTEPRTEPNEIVLHVRMWDEENAAQQEALGTIGVNLIHGAFFHADEPVALLQALLDGLGPGRVEVDMARFTGPAFEEVDHRIVSLHLVEHGLSRAAMFAPHEGILQPAEALYKKAVLVERGTFRPLRPVHLALHEHALHHFRQHLDIDHPIESLKEMSLHRLAQDGEVDYSDFLDRADAVAEAGSKVLVTRYLEHYRVAEYLAQLASHPIAFVAGAPSLRKLFDEQYYTDLSGGRLEAFGRLFECAAKLYVFPFLDDETGQLLDDPPEMVPAHAQHLHTHLVKRGSIEHLDPPDVDTEARHTGAA